MLNKKFFERPTLEVARNLLGCCLINGECVGKIVETEAYLADDPASHSFRGKTARNAAMFGLPGTAYVYFVYGNHYCFNVVTAPEGVGEAVLIRALEPLKGIGLMKKRRRREDVLQLCNGPGKLVEAMDIKMKNNGKNLMEGSLRLELRAVPGRIVSCERIGISLGKELPHRFFINGNKFVSKSKTKDI
ncbi:MAG: DNA-3-methyladenine glycosylase [Nanoarchaeota archaeon]|nr:DNA-3-methyladenine glycosylase [Nanoarchaeota archaeon]MBU0977676.1 DNA-3-methyladenine glycosylase [Nanoarchaeota archaeon]